MDNSQDRVKLAVQSQASVRQVDYMCECNRILYSATTNQNGFFLNYLSTEGDHVSNVHVDSGESVSLSYQEGNCACGGYFWVRDVRTSECRGWSFNFMDFHGKNSVVLGSGDPSTTF